MNEDRVKGKVKDVGGRVERQVGEWTGDTGKQVHGTAKQAEGKVQNAWGKTKDAAKDADRNTGKASEPTDDNVETEHEVNVRTRRKAS